MMKRTLSGMLAILLLIGQWAQAEETGPVAEVWGCTYTGNSGMDGINSATDNFKNLIAELNDPALNALAAYTWIPFRAQTDTDILWFSVHPNLNSFGAVSDLLESPQGDAMRARFFEHVDCGSSLMTMSNIYAAETVEFTAPTLIEAYRCNLNDGKSMADVQSTLDDWRGYVDGTGGFANYVAFMMTPIASSQPFEVYYFGVHASISDYSARLTNNLTSAEGQAMTAKFDALQQCEATTWIGRNMIAPTE